MQRTQVANYDHAIDIIEHVNEDHGRELNAIAKAKYPQRTFKSVILEDIFEEGVLLFVEDANSARREELFVPFTIKGTLEERVFYLAYLFADPDVVQKEVKRFLTVTDKKSLTQNFTRITVRTELPFPEQWAGLCFSTHLKTLTHQTPEQSPLTKYGQHVNRLILRKLSWSLKLIPVKIRRSVVANTQKNVRAYTLRNTWSAEHDGKTHYFGILDIFTHGMSKGSVWADSLKVGDILYTSGDHADNHPALIEGNNVLFCDETAYPAAAGLLQQWTNPMAPTLIIVSHCQAEQAYFDDVILPEGTKVIRITCSFQDQGDNVIKALTGLSHFDTVWGAMESTSAKQVRHFLRNTYKLKGRNNLVKPYWLFEQK
ncbi:siderophore-interacting protein [Veronia pacifica]|uniref:SIP-like Rossmann fold domain-containing protein n=1 Tax=Veronia pacifica TaxID=1080227 RepID=A0A1C3ER84_9GAMM|nr:siderophore-interacting protein [Veronia pacifica]ODA35743.1 hypothetical protein A8L45_03585 [Veronia pacifica]